MGYLHPILTPEAAIEFEKRRLFRRDHEWTAMQRAGRALGRAILADLPEVLPTPRRLRVLLAVGKGHTGRDAMLAAADIRHRLPDMDVFLLPSGKRDDWRTLTTQAFRQLEETGPVLDLNLPTAEQYGFDILLDGLLGMSFTPPLKRDLRDMIRALNAHRRIAFRAAVDLPSGLGDSECLRADFTYATGIVKAPAVEPVNLGDVGRLRYLDLGFFDSQAAIEEAGESGRSVIDASILRPLTTARARATDKRHFGHLMVIGGARTMPGALLMNVEAAVRSGVGLVTVFAPESTAASLAGRVPEAMWVPMPETPDGGLALEGRGLILPYLPRATALLAGSGMGSEAETLALLAEILAQRAVPVAIDADGLRPQVVEAATSAKQPMVLTPHLGEFRRLTGADANGFDDEIRACANRTGATIILKGPITRVSDGERLGYSVEGGPVLARGGSGDILAGLLGGLLAQPDEDTFEVACRAAVWHARAADALARARGSHAVRTTELLDFLNPAVREVV